MNGLAGAHRVGKTTLAKAYAAKHGIPYVETHVSGVFADKGFDARVDYPFDVRLTIQRHILDGLGADYRRGGVNFITDRTPLDALAYCMADVRRENLTEADSANFEVYRDECYSLTNEHFTNILLVQPAIPIVVSPDEANTKGPAIKAYLEHLNSLIFGFLASEENEVAHYFIPRAVMNLERRIACIEYAVKRVSENFKEKRDAMTEAGQLWH